VIYMLHYSFSHAQDARKYACALKLSCEVALYLSQFNKLKSVNRDNEFGITKSHESASSVAVLLAVRDRRT
jgi:hypothetical protein